MPVLCSANSLDGLRLPLSKQITTGFPSGQKTQNLQLFCPVLIPPSCFFRITVLNLWESRPWWFRIWSSGPSITCHKTRLKRTGCACHMDSRNYKTNLLGPRKRAQWLKRLSSNPNSTCSRAKLQSCPLTSSCSQESLCSHTWPPPRSVKKALRTSSPSRTLVLYFCHSVLTLAKEREQARSPVTPGWRETIPQLRPSNSWPSRTLFSLFSSFSETILFHLFSSFLYGPNHFGQIVRMISFL